MSYFIIIYRQICEFQILANLVYLMPILCCDCDHYRNNGKLTLLPIMWSQYHLLLKFHQDCRLVQHRHHCLNLQFHQEDVRLLYDCNHRSLMIQFHQDICLVLFYRGLMLFHQYVYHLHHCRLMLQFHQGANCFHLLLQALHLAPARTCCLATRS